VWASVANFPQGWNRSCPITISYTLLSGGANNLSNFPVLISYNSVSTEHSLPSELMNGTYGQSGGQDIRFSLDSAGATPLNADIQVFQQNATLASAHAVIWVKIPTLSYTANTTIYVWYSNIFATTPLATDSNFGSNGVWPTCYAVWHLSDTGTTITDATGNGNVGTLVGTGAQTTSTPFRYGLTFNGSNQRVNCGNSVSLGTGYSVEAWVNTNASTSGQCAVSYRSTASGTPIAFQEDNGGSSNHWRCIVEDSAGNTATATQSVAPSTNTWYYTTLIRNANSVTNVFVTTTVAASPSPGNFGSIANNSLFIGAVNNGGSYGNYWSGTLSEIRVYTTAKNATWLIGENNLGTAPGSSITCGTAAPTNFDKVGRAILIK
jgi:hypothetical protein